MVNMSDFMSGVKDPVHFGLCSRARLRAFHPERVAIMLCAPETMISSCYVNEPLGLLIQTSALV